MKQTYFSILFFSQTKQIQLLINQMLIQLKRKKMMSKSQPTKPILQEVPDRIGRNYLQLENFSVWPKFSLKHPLPSFWWQIDMWLGKKLPMEPSANYVLEKITIPDNKWLSNQNQLMQEYQCFFQSIDFIRYKHTKVNLRPVQVILIQLYLFIGQT